MKFGVYKLGIYVFGFYIIDFIVEGEVVRFVILYLYLNLGICDVILGVFFLIWCYGVFDYNGVYFS